MIDFISKVNTIPQLYVYILKQDDPRKCTSAKLLRYGYVKQIYKKTAIPRKSIVLNPYSEIILTPLDKDSAERFGVVAIDCSWAKSSEIFSKRLKGLQRRLPLTIPGNPVSYGKIGRLSSLEALAATLIILSYKKEAITLLNLYKWGTTFLDLNMDPLEAYSRCREEEQIRKIEKEILSDRF